MNDELLSMLDDIDDSDFVDSMLRKYEKYGSFTPNEAERIKRKVKNA